MNENNQLNPMIMFDSNDLNYIDSNLENLFNETKSLRKKVFYSLIGNKTKEICEDFGKEGFALNVINLDCHLDLYEYAFHNSLVPFVVERLNWCKTLLFNKLIEDNSNNIDFSNQSPENLKFIDSIHQALGEQMDKYFKMNIRVFTIDIENLNGNLNSFISINGGKSITAEMLCDKFAFKNSKNEIKSIDDAYINGELKYEEFVERKKNAEFLYNKIILTNSSKPNSKVDESDYYPSFALYDLVLTNSNQNNDMLKDYKFHVFILIGTINDIKGSCINKVNRLFGHY